MWERLGMTPTPTVPKVSITEWLRLSALGALAGAVAGALAGVTAYGIQNFITQRLIAKYGSAAVVDWFAPLLAPDAILTLALLGGFVGLAYAVVYQWLTRWGGVPFAILVAVGMQPLLLGRLSFAAVVTVHQFFLEPNGFTKTGDFGQDLLPLPLAVGLMVVLVFLMGLLTHNLLAVALRWVPRLPAAVYALIAAVIGLPALCVFGLFFLLAIGAIGGE